jgi:MIP family channel proteins
LAIIHIGCRHHYREQQPQGIDQGMTLKQPLGNSLKELCMTMSVKKGLYGSELGANMMRTAIAEGIGIFILVFVGTAVASAATLWLPIAGEPLNSLAVGLAFGLILVALVSALGHVSGAHLNPAITLALATTGKFSWHYVPAYLGAQLIGAIAASGTVWLSFGHQAREKAALAATFPTTGTNDLQAFLVEAILTFILVFVVISVATDERVPASAAGPAVGFTLAATILAGGPLTGGAVNPARAIGPMIMAWKFTSMWVYLFAPIVGGILAALLYDRFLAAAEKPQA